MAKYYLLGIISIIVLILGLGAINAGKHTVKAYQKQITQRQALYQLLEK